jgi:uncharacterized protein involved in exopolysaccharide biosynthesis
MPGTLKEAFLSDTGQIGMKGKLLLALGLADPPKAAVPELLFADKMMGAVRVEPMKETHLLRISIREGDAARAAELANAYAKGYIAYLAENAMVGTVADIAAMKKESEELTAKMKESKERLQDYQRRADTFREGEAGGMSGQRAELLAKSVTEAEMTLMNHDSEMRLLKSAKSSGVISVVPGIGSDLIIVELRKKESDVSSKLAEWSGTCGKNHPKIIGFRIDLQDNARQQLARVDEMIREKEGMAAAAQAKVTELKAEYDRSRDQARTENQKMVDQGLLKNEASANEALLNQVNARIKQVELSARLGSHGQVSVADVAIVPAAPVSPKKSIAAVAALLVLGLVGAGVPLGLGFTEHKIWPLLKQATDGDRAVKEEAKPQARRSTQEPITAPVMPAARMPEPMMRPPVSPFFQEVPNYGMPMQAPMVPVAPMAPSQPAPVLAHVPELFSAEPSMQFTELLHPDPLGQPNPIQQIGRALQQGVGWPNGPRVVLVTSAAAGEGKSLVSAALAASLCTSGAKVFLMECHAAAPSLTDWFPHAEGFSAMASDLAALRYGLSHLHILPGNDLPSFDMAELLPGYKRWIQRAWAEVEWILLDAPSLLMGFADVAALAPLATDVLVVHDGTRCSGEQLRAGFNLLKPVIPPDRVRGMVMNRHSLVTD